jgi:phosphate-selective porin OprO/OprP
MRGDRRRRAIAWPLCAVALGALLPVASRTAAAQPPAHAPAAAPATGREAQLEERIRKLETLLQAAPDPGRMAQMEATIKQLSTQVQQLSTRLADSERRLAPANAAAAAPPGAGGEGEGAAGPAGGPPGASAAEMGPGVGAAGGPSPAAPLPTPRFEMPEPRPDLAAKVRFGPGFEIKTTDDEYVLQFHDLTQFDGRFYGNPHQSPVVDTFTFPRQWLIFSGYLTKPYEYYISIANGFDTFNILDVFLNVNYNKALQFRAGRFKSPFTYEFYAEPTQGLPNGEWSLFFNNFGYNRDLGAMVWGQMLRDRLEYAAGIFNSTRNGFVDLSNPKEFIGFMNFAPFGAVKDSPLENFNVGGSVVAGSQQHIPFPQEFRTIVPTNGNTVLGVPFLNLNNDVVASGPQAFWSLHSAYFYKQLSLIGEWQSGYEEYARAPSPARTRVPVESFYVQAAYLLTGERVSMRGMVKPLHPFDLRKGKFGPGAWEVAFRYSLLDLGSQVFTSGLADPNLWTNRLYATDLGLSWYWNEYIRLLFDWQHAGFGSPVLARPGFLQKRSDMFLMRFQIWF